MRVNNAYGRALLLLALVCVSASFATATRVKQINNKIGFDPDSDTITVKQIEVAGHHVKLIADWNGKQIVIDHVAGKINFRIDDIKFAGPRQDIPNTKAKIPSKLLSLFDDQFSSTYNCATFVNAILMGNETPLSTKLETLKKSMTSCARHYFKSDGFGKNDLDKFTISALKGLDRDDFSSSDYSDSSDVEAGTEEVVMTVEQIMRDVIRSMKKDPTRVVQLVVGLPVKNGDVFKEPKPAVKALAQNLARFCKLNNIDPNKLSLPSSGFAALFSYTYSTDSDKFDSILFRKSLFFVIKNHVSSE